MKIVAIVQARTGSTRLMGKVLLNLLGEPMLVHEMARIGRSESISSTIVATTDLPADDRIVDLCKKQGWQYCRGSEQDVLDRYYQCAKKAGADVIVRLTSDCPLIEPAVIDRVIEKFLQDSQGLDYVSNVIAPRTFPRGLDTEVFSFAALERSWNEDKNPLLREHVTQYIVQNPDKFRTAGITNPLDLSDFRWTVDTNEDFRLVTEIYSHFGHNRFTLNDVLSLMEKRPELRLINQDIAQKEVSHS
jgi:spore coat polysaccharide biosynthesis protein SpsF